MEDAWIFGILWIPERRCVLMVGVRSIRCALSQCLMIQVFGDIRMEYLEHLSTHIQGILQSSALRNYYRPPT